MEIKNPEMATYSFLSGMYNDQYFPRHLVKKCEDILRKVCLEIESKTPVDLSELYAITCRATEEINDLEDEFEESDSEIETVARETLGADFRKIARAYGFQDADPEELIATREW